MGSIKNKGIFWLIAGLMIGVGIYLYREFGSDEAMLGYGGHMMPYMGGLMLVFWGIVLAALILMILYLITAGRNETDADEGSRHAREILRGRYARGEIDQSQYLEMRKEISR